MDSKRLAVQVSSQRDNSIIKYSPQSKNVLGRFDFWLPLSVEVLCFV